MTPRLLLLLLLGIAVLGGCARLPDIGVAPYKHTTVSTLQKQLLSERTRLESFRQRGPFEVAVREDEAIDFGSRERIEADLYLSGAPDKAPLVILVHGYDNSKDEHAYQGFHLASWGLHALVVNLPNEGPWDDNGRTLGRLVRHLQRQPQVLDPRIDAARIILAGHSFGATSVAIALAEGAPASGAVLLDPASPLANLPSYLRRIRAPLMVLMADPKLGETNGGGDFFEYTGSGVAQVSIANASHDDATFPIASPLERLFSGSEATEEHQITFVAALTAAATSLGTTGKLDYAWSSYASALKTGMLFDALRK
jgi:pimeloyl-ACP methyl ester carboxylesterase